jgi:hypothetical protein
MEVAGAAVVEVRTPSAGGRRAGFIPFPIGTPSLGRSPLLNEAEIETIARGKPPIRHSGGWRIGINPGYDSLRHHLPMGRPV